MDVVLAQDVLDRFNACRNRGFVIGRAILAEKVFEHIGGDNGVPLHGLHQVLTDHETGKMLIDLVIKGRHRHLRNRNLC